MSIKAYVGDKFTALSTDNKPDNVDTGAVLYEIDTNLIYLKKNNIWVCLNCINANLNQGPTGPIGLQGVQGNVGSQGGRGIPGANGVQGVQGPTGSIGMQGVQGRDGLSCICPYYWWGPFSPSYVWGKWFLWRDYDRLTSIQDVGVHIFYGITWSGSMNFVNGPNIKIITTYDNNFNAADVTITNQNGGNFIYDGVCFKQIKLGIGSYEFISTPAGILVMNNMLQNNILPEFHQPFACTDLIEHANVDDPLRLDTGAEYGIPFTQLATQYIIHQETTSIQGSYPNF